MDLEKVARQDRRYWARTSPPAEAWGSSRPKLICNREATSPCFYKASLVTVEVVVLDVERSCSKGEQREENGASRGTRKRRSEKEEEKGEREKEENKK